MKPAPPVLREGDYRDQPWIGPLFRALNTFFTSVAALLGGGLALEDNVRAQVDTLSFTTGASVATSFPIDLTVRMGAQPAHVLVTRVVDLDAQDATFTSFASWRMEGDKLRILMVSGLSTTKRYQVTLLSLP